MRKMTMANKEIAGTASVENMALLKTAGAGALADYGTDAGMGMENVRQDEVLVPFLRILQSNSPQCEPDTGIEGAKPGMLFNTATNEMFDGKSGVLFVPCWRMDNYIEFVPRNNGGGFVAAWESGDPRIRSLRQAQGEFGKITLQNGNELIETFYLFGLAAAMVETPEGYRPGDWFQCVIGFSSTQIKKYKIIMGRLNDLCGVPARAPIFAFSWRLGTVAESNKKGKFFGWRVGMSGPTAATSQLPPDSPLYFQARQFALRMKEGNARADYDASGVNVDEDGVLVD
jgi:hypothetical protein